MKTVNVKKQFVKKNFLILFSAFVLPTLILGSLMVYLSWRNVERDARRRLENTVSLAEEHLHSLTDESKAVNVYIESNQLLSSLSRMLDSKSIQYPEMIAFRHFSAFINSIVYSNALIDSIYLYLPNSLDRVYTSAGNFVFLESLTDQEWVDMLSSGGAGQRLCARVKTDYPFETPRQVLTVFNTFHNFQGGSVINFSSDSVRHTYDSMLFYEGQGLFLLDSDNHILVHNAKLSEEEISLWSQSFLEDTFVDYHLVHTAEYPEYGLRLVTAVPNRILYHSAIQNAQLTIIITLMIALITVILAYMLSLNSYHQLNQIVSLLDSAARKEPLPEVEYNTRDMYSQILHNIIRIFLENNYLQIQLSERKLRLQTAQLQALQYQINPHFLYNTLQTINYEILALTKGKQTHANQMVENLSDIMRFSLEAPNTFVTLDEELEHCRKYVEIQQARYDNGFQVLWDIDETLAETMIPRLLLQPLVENAIVHGLKQTSGNGRIKITVRKKYHDASIEVRICDNGSGIPGRRLREIRQRLRESDLEYTSAHIGLPNCCQRLLLTYSPESMLHIRSKEGMGTLVWFRLPSS